MIYQFEYDEINRCRECPCHSWADFPDEKDWCDLQDKQLAYDTEPEYNDCPLVAIPKTETTSEPCEWCKNTECRLSGTFGSCPVYVACEDCVYNMSDKKYCPNCGRKLVSE